MSGEGFLSKNLVALTSALESSMLNEKLARQSGLLQSLDPRVKVISTILFIIAAGLARNLLILTAILVMLLIFSLLSRIPTDYFLKRILIFIPIFTLVIAVPALFITQGDALIYIGGKALITRQGVQTAGFLFLRVTDSLSLGVLLILTTPWNRLLAALRWFHIPALFIDILGMTYRYIFLFLHTANSMFLARRSRTFGRITGSENRHWLMRSAGTTLVKTQHLSEEVYLAMLSRGYRGETRSIEDNNCTSRDLIWVVFSLMTSALLVWKGLD
jgi:cobalt/nickel transport system permease protein